MCFNMLEIDRPTFTRLEDNGERNISWGWPYKISISMYTVNAKIRGCAV